jgi:hypothetical protein
MLGHRRRRRSCHAGRSSAMKLHARNFFAIFFWLDKNSPKLQGN